MSRLVIALCSALLLAGCGGGGTTSSPATDPGSPGGTPAPGSGGGTPNTGQPIAIIVSGGEATGVDIVTSAPVGANPNVKLLGATTGGGSTAYNSGDIVHRGATQQVIVFGDNLTPDMQITVAGPGDIQVLPGVSQVTSTTGVKGLTFRVTALPTATLGGRSVLFKAPDGDITSFTGGLEVVP